MKTTCRQVNIIANAALEAKLIRLAHRVQASGYTAFHAYLGHGSTGVQTSSTDGDSNIMFMMIIDPATEEKLIEEINKITARGYPLKVFINEIYTLGNTCF